MILECIVANLSSGFVCGKIAIKIGEDCSVICERRKKVSMRRNLRRILKLSSLNDY